MKEQKSTHFELWLAAYESHLVQLKQGKAPILKKTSEKSSGKSEAPAPKRP